MNVTVSAPGKLLLLGEHAVLYGQPCIVTAINERLIAKVSIAPKGEEAIETHGVDDTSFVREAIRQAAAHWNIKDLSVHIETTSAFSGKYGLGSSAAVTAATLKGVSVLFQKEVTNWKLFQMAYSVIVSVQGVASGADVAAAIYGGIQFFTKNEKPPEKLSVRHLPIIVAYTGTKANTVDMVNEVSKKHKIYPEKVDRIFTAIGKIVVDAKYALEENDWQTLGKLLNDNQEYLRDLGVSSPKLEQLISAARKAGALGAKLSGAGGGDCMIALLNPEVHQSKSLVEKALKEAGGEVVDIVSSAQGVRTEL